MQSEWLTAAESAITLGVHLRHVQLAAKAGNWREHPEGRKVRGGVAKLFHYTSVIQYARLKGIAVPEWLSAMETAPPGLQLVHDVPAPAEPESGAWDSVSEKGRQEAAARLATVEAWLSWAASKRGNMAAFVAYWRKAHPDQRGISKCRVYAWVKAHQQGGIRALVPGWYSRTSNGPSIAQDFWELFEPIYLDESRPSLEQAYRQAEALALANDIEIPHIAKVRRRVELIPEAIRIRHRYGKKASDDKSVPHMMLDVSKLPANSWWISDHHQVDILCRDERGRLVFPWVTVFQDWRSRMWVGWCVHTNPNTDTILLAFARAVREYGLPEHVKVDNGKDYRSALVTGGWQQLRLEIDQVRAKSVMGLFDLDVRFAKPFNAKAKPIERTFRIVKEWFSKMFESYRGGNVLEKPERLKEFQAHPERCPTVAELDVLFAGFVNDVYNRMPCRGNGAHGKPRRAGHGGDRDSPCGTAWS